MESKGRTVVFVVVVIVVVIAVLAVAMVMSPSSHGDVDASLDDDTLTVTTEYVDEEIPIGSIDNVDYVTDMDFGTLVEGAEYDDFLSGTFENDVFGEYVLAAYGDVSAFIVVYWSDGVLVFNLESVEDTEDFFEDLYEAAIGS